MQTLRDAGFDNISLDLVYGIPGQSAADLAADLADALALAPEHLSCYELEAKPGTRFTHTHGQELRRQAEAMEDYFEQVVETLTGAGYRWYETANFCRSGDGRDLRAHTTWRSGVAATTSGSGSARSRRSGRRPRRNLPSLARLRRRARPGETRRASSSRSTTRRAPVERLMLGLRLDEPFPWRGRAGASTADALERLVAGGLVERVEGGVRLTRQRPPARRRGDRRAARLTPAAGPVGRRRAGTIGAWSCGRVTERVVVDCCCSTRCSSRPRSSPPPSPCASS